MKSSQQLAMWTAVLLVVASPLVAAAEAERVPVLQLDGWIEVASPHLRLITDAPSAVALELLGSLEELRATVGSLAGGLATPARVPTTIVLFADESSYAPFRLVGREGQFFPTAYDSLIVLNGGSETRPVGMAASHEYVHALVAELDAALPLWLHEGLAEFYSTFALEAGRAAIGRAVPGHHARLRNRAFVPFAEFAAVDGRSDAYHGEQGARFYAQSWLVVHYLMSIRSPGLDAVLGSSEPGESPPFDMAALLGLPWSALDGEMRHYLNRPTLPVSLYSVARDEASHQWTPVALQKSDAAYHLGIVALEQARWDSGRLRFAADLLEAAVALDPTSGDAQAGLASLCALEGRWEAAEKTFERAVYLDPLEGRSFAYYARHLLQRPGRSAAERLRVERRAREMIARGLDLEPGHGRLEEQLARLDSQVSEPLDVQHVERSAPPSH